jgi:glycine cleavage system H lipoate-binding protein
VTEDPYGEGWLLSIRPAAREELDALLTAEEYVRFVVGNEPPDQRSRSAPPWT